MGVLDRFLDAIKLNDEDEDYLDDEFLDDEEDFLDDEELEEKPRRRFMDRFGSKKKSRDIDEDYEEEYDDEEDDYDDSYDEEDDYEEEEPEPVVRKTASVRKESPAPSRTSKAAPRPRASETPARSSSSFRSERPAASKPVSSSKITPMRNSRRSGEASMEVCVLRPLSMENTREIADTLMDHSTVILNLEGLDLELAQRIIDFASGACYALGGTLQKVSGYIFVLGPSNVDITGDMTNLLGYETSVSAGY